MLKCDVCFEDKRIVSKCFFKCTFITCDKCMTMLLKLNSYGIIQHCCPQCRSFSYNIRKHKIIDITDSQQVANIKFGVLCIENIKLTKKIFDIYEERFKHQFDSDYSEDDS